VSAMPAPLSLSLSLSLDIINYYTFLSLYFYALLRPPPRPSRRETITNGLFMRVFFFLN